MRVARSSASQRVESGATSLSKGLRAVFRGWKARTAAAVVAVLVVALAGLWTAAGFFDRDPIHLFGMDGGRKPIAAVYFSGDMGLRFGMGPYVASALADRGVPVLGVASSTQFATHHSRQQVDAAVADAIRDTLKRTGAKQLLVLGQSFGSDMVRVGLIDLPADLRKRVAAVTLVVPGETAYFRADPSGLAYRGPPDAGPAEARALNWVRVTCIQGAAETDSLCPALTMPNVHRIALPGGHFLNNDHQRLVDTILSDLAAYLPPAKAK
jgi:type IV secretory pathway VirJ component